MAPPVPGTTIPSTRSQGNVATPTSASRPTLGGKGLGLGRGKKGVANRRHRKIVKETIRGITKGDIRRLARRGGIKRISAAIYDDMRGCIRDYLHAILKDCVIFLDHNDRKTCTVSDVIFALKRRGRPIYGFDKDTYKEKANTRRRRLLPG
ncbi:MAG: hypothetical protein M1829_004564 [Trizodia sp. TS-e1964]|nr:MAG: hypothetical protein M1829_004564 [Trizodia sp. TS-e1964]